MIRVNLLPYRDARRHQQILQHLGAAAAVIAFAGILSLGAHWIASSELSSLQEEYTQLKAQNDVLKKKIGKIRNLDALRADVERKLKLVDTLQKGRFRSLVTLNEIARVIPENVWLTSVTNDGPTIKMSGLGESNKAVANFMRMLDESKIFTNVSLSVISRVDAGGVPVRSFSLSLTRIDAPEPALKASAGGAS
ncbi:MAG: PilN domain-containing protein [Mariprofundaceae bacterium]